MLVWKLIRLTISSFIAETYNNHPNNNHPNKTSTDSTFWIPYDLKSCISRILILLLNKEAVSFTYLMIRVNKTPDHVIIDFLLKTSSYTANHSEEVCIHSFHERHKIPAWYPLFGSQSWIQTLFKMTVMTYYPRKIEVIFLGSLTLAL